jgi:DNA-binding MarR family transcriptional regulator
MKGNFEDEWHQMRANLVSIGSKLRLHYASVFEPYDLTHQQFNALRILRGRQQRNSLDSFSTQDLRAALVDKSSDSSRLVDRMIQKGWVIKEPCVTDTRRVNLTISEKGLELLSLLDIETRKLNDYLKVIDQDDVSKLNSLLDKIENNL